VTDELHIKHTMRPHTTLLQELSDMAALAKFSGCTVTAEYEGMVLVIEPGDGPGQAMVDLLTVCMERMQAQMYRGIA
jgi:hypothetical protein